MVLRDPSGDETLWATQVKDKRESGSLTLNSPDLLEAVLSLWALQAANPGRLVNFTFLTTSPIGMEIKAPLDSGERGINEWLNAGSGGGVTKIRKALAARFEDGTLATFIGTASDDEFRDQLLNRFTFVCGAGDGQDVEDRSRLALRNMRKEVNATSDMAERAYDILFAQVLRTIISSPTRSVTRDDFLQYFQDATSIPMPSQTVADLAAHGAAQLISEAEQLRRAGNPIPREKLRQIAQDLLTAGTPPSIIHLFPDASSSAQCALKQLGNANRTVTNTEPQGRTTANVDELHGRTDYHNLILAPPGSGKTHALWHLAKKMLSTGEVIPLYLSLGGLDKWAEVLRQVTDVSNGLDATEVLRDPRICIIFDGWSEFAPGQFVNERRIALRALSRARIIANGRRGAEVDGTYKVWDLDPLPLEAVRSTVKLAIPNSALSNSALVEFLRLPLALSLFVLLNGAASSRGELLSQFHNHLSRSLPEGFTGVVSGAVASVSLSGSRSFLKLQSAVREYAQLASIAEPLKQLSSLGTLEDRAGVVLPIHDLYWSWLNGVGLLGSQLVAQSLPDLTNRESYKLALESGAGVKLPAVASVIKFDAVLAAILSAGLNCPVGTSPDLQLQMAAMFADAGLPIRYRAALAALYSGRPELLRQALDVITETTNARLYFPGFTDALSPVQLYRNRDILYDWIGSEGSDFVIDAIANEGRSEWVPWLERVAQSGKLPPELAAAAALACSGEIPAWTIPYLKNLISARSWKLRPVASRGTNLKFAHWVAEHYGEFEGTGNGRWIELNKILIACGDEETFEFLLSQFLSMPPAAQETLDYAVVELGDPWLGRFQRLAFSVVGTEKAHHKLAEVVSDEIDEATARTWIANGHYEIGWRTVIALRGEAVVPELLTTFPPTFDGIHDIPALAVMRFLDRAPASLLPEIRVRIRGVMQPKAMQDVVNALSRIKPAGIMFLIEQIVSAPHAFPAYHLGLVLRLLPEWESENKSTIRLQTGMGDMSFLTRLSTDKTEQRFQYALVQNADLAVQLIVSDLNGDIDVVKQILGLMKPLTKYDHNLFNYLISKTDLAIFVPRIFSGSFDSFPEDSLLIAFNTAGVGFNDLVRAVALATSAAHRDFHEIIVRRALCDPMDIFVYRDVAKMLRVHSRTMLFPLLQRVMPVLSSDGLWLVREIEAARNELLIDEQGGWFS